MAILTLENLACPPPLPTPFLEFAATFKAFIIRVHLEGRERRSEGGGQPKTPNRAGLISKVGYIIRVDFIL